MSADTKDTMELRMEQIKHQCHIVQNVCELLRDIAQNEDMPVINAMAQMIVRRVENIEHNASEASKKWLVEKHGIGGKK